MVKKFRKKPVEIEAIQFTGNNHDELKAFCDKVSFVDDESISGLIYTLEGDMIIEKDNYLIKGVKGEFYPCREDIFLLTYDESSDTDNVAEKGIKTDIVTYDGTNADDLIRKGNGKIKRDPHNNDLIIIMPYGNLNVSPGNLINFHYKKGELIQVTAIFTEVLNTLLEK